MAAREEVTMAENGGRRSVRYVWVKEGGKMKLCRSGALQSLAMTVATVVVVCSSGCTWVALAPEAEAVRISGTDEVEGCTRVGTTKTRTKSKVGIFARGEKKVAEELSTLARNDSVELGGNTVVAEGPVSAEGTQRFVIYDCPSKS